MTHREFFDALKPLSPLRVISITGPSVFETICRLDAYGLKDAQLDAITDAYHWHVNLAQFRHLRSHDEMHARSGRRVLFFTLHDRDGAEPFLRIYVHRARGEEFDAERERRFAEVHARAAQGVEVTA